MASNAFTASRCWLRCFPTTTCCKMFSWNYSFFWCVCPLIYRLCIDFVQDVERIVWSTFASQQYLKIRETALNTCQNAQTSIRERYVNLCKFTSGSPRGSSICIPNTQYTHAYAQTYSMLNGSTDSCTSLCVQACALHLCAWLVRSGLCARRFLLGLHAYIGCL